MAVGHSDDVDPLDAIAAAIVTAVRERFPGVGIMGSTSSAQISSVIGFREDSISLVLFASDTIDVTVGLGSGLGTDVNAAGVNAQTYFLTGRRTP